jgi:glyoxylase-like metal-dependent hydrolase (beta-lactamase superfamily II)
MNERDPAAVPSAGWTMVAALLVVSACGGESSAPEILVDVPRTADPAARGLDEADFPRVQEVAPGVYAYEALRSAGDERFTTVSMFVVTPAGVLVADGQGSVDETERMLAAIAAATDEPVTHLVVSSDHGDHTGGNTAFPERIEVLAHPTSAAVLDAAAERARAAGDGRAIPPVATQIVSDRTLLDLGGREIEVLFLGRAHTGGDLAVHVPDGGVVFMSEAYLNRVFPAMRSAFPTEWVQMIERAQTLDADVYLPGHGFVEAPAVLQEELETYRRALVRVIEEGRRLHGEGVPVDEAIEQARFGDLDGWSLRSSQAATAIRRVYAELNGELPASEAR